MTKRKYVYNPHATKRYPFLNYDDMPWAIKIRIRNAQVSEASGKTILREEAFEPTDLEPYDAANEKANVRAAIAYAESKVIYCRVCGTVMSPLNTIDPVELPDECCDCAAGEFPGLFGE